MRCVEYDLPRPSWTIWKTGGSYKKGETKMPPTDRLGGTHYLVLDLVRQSKPEKKHVGPEDEVRSEGGMDDLA